MTLYAARTFVCLLLFYAIVTVFQLYNGGDMTYEMGFCLFVVVLRPSNI